MSSKAPLSYRADEVLYHVSFFLNGYLTSDLIHVTAVT